MTVSRLSLALDDGAALPPSGGIVVIGATADTDLSAFPKDRLTVVQGFRPDHDRLAAKGFEVRVATTGSFAGAVICLPRSRDEARALVAEAAGCVEPGGPIWLDGQKTDGIDAMLRDVRSRAALSAPVAKAHGKCAMFRCEGPAAFTDWVTRDTRPAPGFTARPGCFSADGIDPGSQVLADALPAGLKGRGADLGAGWGWLAAQVLRQPGVTELHLVEAQHMAVEAARANISDPRAVFHWADATGFRPDRPLDFIVMNPPFHRGRAADPAIGQGFVRAAAGMLAPSGVLWMVANRHLPYEDVLNAAFGEVAEAGADRAFKVLRASRPRKGPPRRNGHSG